jgi:ferredoxin
MVKLQVDWDRCQNYGQCIFEAPRVFRFNDQDRLEYEPEASDDDLEAAIDVCPMQAIAVVDP